MKYSTIAIALVIAGLMIVPAAVVADDAAAEKIDIPDKFTISPGETLRLSFNSGEVKVKLVSGSNVSVRDSTGMIYKNLESAGDETKFLVKNPTGIEIRCSDIEKSAVVHVEGSFAYGDSVSSYDNHADLAKGCIYAGSFKAGMSGYIDLHGSVWVYQKDSAADKAFRDGIAGRSLPSHVSSIEVIAGKEYDVYRYVSDPYSDTYTEYLYISGMYGNTNVQVELSEKISLGSSELPSFFVEGHSTFKVAVSKPGLYLVYSSSYGNQCVALEPGYENVFTNEEAREYHIAYAAGNNEHDVEPFIDFEYTVSGVPAGDNIGIVFCIISIGLCAGVFVLAFLAGRKPSWSQEE